MMILTYAIQRFYEYFDCYLVSICVNKRRGYYNDIFKRMENARFWIVSKLDNYFFTYKYLETFYFSLRKRHKRCVAAAVCSLNHLHLDYMFRVICFFIINGKLYSESSFEMICLYWVIYYNHISYKLFSILESSINPSNCNNIKCLMDVKTTKTFCVQKRTYLGAWLKTPTNYQKYKRYQNVYT